MNTELDISLPKWPAIVVYGDRVTELQATEIIVRTDLHFPDFSYAGNDMNIRDTLNDLFKIPKYPSRDQSKEGFIKEFADYNKKIKKIESYYKKINLEYLYTQNIVSAYVRGPCGWVDWQGNINYHGHNIGKWPSVDAVLAEWNMIAAAFPYLNLTCILFNKEACEEGCEPVIQFRIKDGKASIEPQIDNSWKTKVKYLSPDNFDFNFDEIGIDPIDLLGKVEDVYRDGIYDIKKD
jgi:hypothetical protein